MIFIYGGHSEVKKKERDCDVKELLLHNGSLCVKIR